MTARPLMPFQHAKMRIERARYRLSLIEAGEAADPGVLRGFARDLVAALDSVVVDLARVRSLDPEDVKFPFAPDRQKLADILDVDFRRIDEDLADYLYRLAPWKGGNRDLWLLHELDVGEAAAPALPALEELFRSVTDTVQALGDRFGRRA